MIDDIALEISLDTRWRKRLKEQAYNVKIEISFRKLDELPQYIQKDICCYKLEFWVMKVKQCQVPFDKELEVFKFQSKEYPKIVSFSGNNLNIL